MACGLQTGSFQYMEIPDLAGHAFVRGDEGTDSLKLLFCLLEKDPHNALANYQLSMAKIGGLQSPGLDLAETPLETTGIIRA